MEPNPEIGQLIDHGAAVQRGLDELNRQVVLLAAAVFALSVALALTAWRLHHQGG